MVKTGNPGDLRKWLEGKPTEWAQALALRSALRVLPVALDPSSNNDIVTVSRLTQALLRATAISWAARNIPAHDMIGRAADAAARAADTARAAAYAADAARAAYAADAAARAAAYAADTARAAAYAADTARAADAAARAADADIWAAISGDCDFLENTDFDAQAGSPALLAQPLWYGKALLIPERKLEASWKRARENLKTEKFDIWIDWYRRRLAGETQGFDLPTAADLEIQSRLLDQENDWWERGLGPVTEDIEGWIREQRELLRAADELAVLDNQQALNTIIDSSSPEFRTTADNKIDAGPNPEFDVPTLDHDLTELPAILRALIQTILTSLPNNTPPVVRSSLEGYEQHLLERGAQPIVGLVKAWMDAVRAEYASNDAELWGKGLDSLFQSTFEKHELLIEHFPLDEKREAAIASLEFDDAKAMGAEVIGALQNIGKALEALKEGQRTTEETDKVAAALKQQDDDYISLPIASPPIVPDDDALIPTTPRKRFMAARLSIAERLYAATGATVTIASTSSGQAAMQYLASALDILRPLFGL